MAPGQDMQLEKVIGEMLKRGDARGLDVFLQRDIHEGTSLNCSQHFLSKLDKLIHKCLDQKDSKSASLVLAFISKCGDNLKLPSGGQGLCGLVGRGIIKKMVQWFEKCRQLWIQCGPQWDEPLFNLSEDFFDALMVVHGASKEGTCKITESFLYPVGQLGIDPRIYIPIQKEAIHKFNLILDKIPVELKKERKILTSQEASDIMVKLAGRILEGGDYDLQTALTEALCRMATPGQRRESAGRWFSMEYVASAFVKICDSEFETDCRKFLNLVNGMQGDRRRVYSYPCLEVYLDKHELLIPADEKLEEFWIDFNLGSHSISFYFSVADGDGEGQWDTICINENEVQSYTVKEEGKRKVLQLKLSEVVTVSGVEGSTLTIHFSSSLDIRQAAHSIYGQSKNTSFVGKMGTSVVKTTVKIIMDSNSQVVPESQLSLSESEKSTAPYPLPAPTAPVQTPAKMKISEATTFLSNSAGGKMHSAGSLSAFMQNTLSKGKGKQSLQTCSHHTTPSSTTAGMVQQNSSLEKAADKVQTRQGEEQSLEDNYVPDTQPRSMRQISSNWGRLSVSEMLKVPTQGVKTLQRLEHRSSLSHQQQQPVALRLSVPDSGPIRQKQFFTKLTQRMQKVHSEGTQDCAPQEAAAPQGKMSESISYSKSRNTADQCSFTVCAPKVQQAQKSGLGKGKTKHQMSLEADAAPNKAPVKAPNTTSLQQRVTPNVGTETNMALSSKEKRDAKVAQSMVKLISSHYEINTKSSVKKMEAENIHEVGIPPRFNRPIFNMSWSTAKKDTSAMKSNSKRATNSSRKDIFAFSIDTPLAIRGKDKPLNVTSASSSSDIHDSSRFHNTTKKGQLVTKEKQNVKKHLFSDTDTDNAMTEISWLRESSRKPKPKVTKYSRQAPINPKAESPQTSSGDSSHLPPPSPKPLKGNTKPNKKKHTVEESVKQPKKMVKPLADVPNRPHAAGRRPRRAAAASTKSYREPDTDDSQSESENVSAPKYSASDHLENTEKTHETVRLMKDKSATKDSLKLESSSICSRRLQIEPEQPSTSKQQRLENVLEVTPKFSEKKITPVQEQKSALKELMSARQTSYCPSSPFIERMRSYERSAPTLDLTFSPLVTPGGSPLPASPDPACQDTPSPILLLPKPRSTVSSNGNLPPSHYSAAKKRSTSRTQSVQSAGSLASLRNRNVAPSPPIGPSAAEISPNQKCLSPATPLPVFTQPLLTSTFFELDKPSLPSPPRPPFPEDSNSNLYGISKVSSISRASLSPSSTRSSVLTGRVNESPSAALTVFHKTEKTPPSDANVEPEEPLMSGPSRKRHVSISNTSEEDEREEKKKGKMRLQRCPQMKPRKLFKSFIELSTEGEMSQVMSSSHTVSSRQWEAEQGSGDIDMDEDLELPGIAFNQSNVCQQFSSELKKKVQNRYKMVEVYNKQSLKTVQQHVSSLNMQVTKHRAQRLEQVQKVLLEEINNLEHDDTALRNMEKDLTIYWKKQATAFHSYQERETRRNESLRKALQSNMCHSLEYEERVFTSQMGLMRKDMKSVQDRLLSEMYITN